MESENIPDIKFRKRLDSNKKKMDPQAKAKRIPIKDRQLFVCMRKDIDNKTKSY